MVASLVSQSPNQDLHPMADAPRSTHEVMSKSASIMVSLAINQEIKMKKKKKNSRYVPIKYFAAF